MSSISRRLDFFACVPKNIDNINEVLLQRNFNLILSDYVGTDFDYYNIINDYEFSHNAVIPIIQICPEVNVDELRKKHILTVHKDPNTKLRIKALKAGAADAISYPFSTQELFSRLNRIVDRIYIFYDSYQNYLVKRNSRLKLEYIETDMGFDIGPNWSVADYDMYLCSTSGAQVQLTSKERLILKALVEADGEPITKTQLHNYLVHRHQEQSYDSIAPFIGLLNKKLNSNNVGYAIQRMSSYGYILIKK